MTGREVATRYSAIADGMTRHIDGCRDWSAPTPCPGWTTLDIITHVVEVHRGALSLLDEAQALPSADDDADVVVAAWHAVTASMVFSLEDPERATRVVSPRFGDMPFEDLVSRMVCSDTLVHTWDLARATQQDERLDAHAVEYAWTWMQVAGDNLRASGSFGPAVPPPDGADTQTRLLCFLGRAV
jgi:uncharacterized protein (TIGR03086 family)